MEVYKFQNAKLVGHSADGHVRPLALFFLITPAIVRNWFLKKQFVLWFLLSSYNINSQLKR